MRAQVLPTVARTTKGTLKCPLYSWGEPTLLTSMGRARATACCMHCATALATLFNTHSHHVSAEPLHGYHLSYREHARNVQGYCVRVIGTLNQHLIMDL